MSVKNQTEIKPLIYRIKQTCQVTGLSRSSIYEKQNAASKQYDKTFPKKIKLGERSAGHVAAEVHAWVDSKIKESRQAAAA